MSQFGRVLLIIGAVVMALGVALIVGERLGLGRLPGDITWKKKGLTVYLPLGTSIVLSILLTLLLNLWLRKR